MKQIYFFYDRKNPDDRLVLNFNDDTEVDRAFTHISNARGRNSEYVDLKTREGLVSMRVDYAYARVEDYEDLLQRTYGKDTLDSWNAALQEYRTKTGRFSPLGEMKVD